MRIMKKNYLLTMFIVLTSLGAFAQLGTTTFNTATDVGSSYTSGTWLDGSNLGTGFGTWSLTNSGTSGRYIGGTGQGADSFGVYSEGSGNFSAAERNLSSDLKMGETFSVNVGHTATINGEVFVQFLDDGVAVFILKFVGGDDRWRMNDGGSDFDSGQLYSANSSLAFTFTYNEDGTYSYTFGSGSGNNIAAANTISGINSVKFQSTNQGSSQNFGINNLSIDSKYTIANNSTVASDATITVPYLDVQSGSTVNIGTTSGTTVSGNLNVDGALNIASGSSLMVSGTSAGNVTYNRNLSFSSGDLEGWHLVGSPVVGQAFNDGYVTANSIASGTGTNRGIATYNNGVATGNWDYFTATGSGTFGTASGYSVKTSVTTDVSFTGTINTDAVVKAITIGAGTADNLLSNPFTSFINSATFLTTNTAKLVSETIYVWNPSSKNYDAKVSGDAFKLAPGQGFFVTCGTAGDVTFNEAIQSHESDTFLKSSSKPEILLNITDGDLNRYAKIYYNDIATTSFDNGYDGETFSGVANKFDVFTQLLTNNQGKNYQVQALPSSDLETMVVPVGVKAAINTEITFSVEALNLPSGIKVYLEDRTANTITRLDEANSEYKITLDEALNGAGRFYLHTAQKALSIDTNATLENVSVYKTNASTLRVVGLQQGNASVKLFNMLGKQVMSSSFTTSGAQNITLPQLAKGVYIVQLTTETGKLNKKIVLE